MGSRCAESTNTGVVYSTRMERTVVLTVESSGRAGSVLRSFSSTVRWGCCCSWVLLDIAKVLGGLFRASSAGSACSLRGPSRPGSGLSNFLSHTRRPFPFVVQFLALSKVKDVGTPKARTLLVS